MIIIIWVENLCQILEAWIVLVFEIAAVEGVWSWSNNGLVAVTFGSPTPSTEPIRPEM